MGLADARAGHTGHRALRRSPAAPDFDRTTAVRATSTPGIFDVDLSPAWGSLIGQLGGSLAAVAVRAVEATAPGRHVRTIATSFYRSASPGPARLTVDVLHTSRSVSSLLATLTQGDRRLTSTRATLVADRAGVEWSTPRSLVAVAPEQCVPIQPPQPAAAFVQVDGVLDPSSLPFTGLPDAVVRGYLRPREPRPVDAAWLAMATDWFPPPAFVRLTPPSGGISIDLVTHVHRTVPDLGADWLTAEFRVDTSTAGLAVEHGRIATRDGHLLAESFHTRWTATD